MNVLPTPRRPTALPLILLLAAALAGLAPLGAQEEPKPPSELAAEASRQMRLGDYELAIELLKSALEQKPELHGVRFQLAGILAFLGRFDEAEPEFAAVVAADPQNSAARRGEVTALILQERYGEARRKLEEGLSALPRDGQLAHTLARLVASAPDEAVRDGQLAVGLARKVFDIKRIVSTAETLAMAYAEAGNFERAAEVQKEAIEMAKTAADAAQLEPLRKRLAGYERGEAWVAESPIEIATATEPPTPTAGS